MAFDKGHALVIGVGTHRHHPGIDVRISVTDAEAVAAVLRDANACGYPAGQVQVVHDAGATKAGILAALDDLAAAAKPDDTAFLFFCGHGALGTDGNYYLVGHDARVQNGRVVAGTGVSEAELLQKLRGIAAQRMLLLFNACHSGNLSPSLDIAPETLDASNPDADAAAALLGTGQGRILIAACREQQVSYIGKGTLSIFTQALVDGLRGKGSVRNTNGFISAFSLYEHLYEAVGDTVKDQCHAVQEPELTVLRGVGPFAVALYKGATALGDFAGDEPLPAGMAAREVSPEKSARYFRQHIDTGGGAYVGESVHTGGGDFIGRDKVVTGGGSAVNTGSGVAFVGDGNTVITGKVRGEVRVTNAVTKPEGGRAEFQALLEEIRQQLAALPASSDRMEAAAELARVEELARRDALPAGRVTRGLENVHEILEGITAATALGALVAKAIQMAGSLFRRVAGETDRR